MAKTVSLIADAGSAERRSRCFRKLSSAAIEGRGLSYLHRVAHAGRPAGICQLLGARRAVPGPETAIIGEAARESQVFVTIGVIEREGGTLYCTALFFGPDGALLGKHRKLMPTAAERLCWGFGDGSTLTTVDTPWGKMAR